MPHIIAGSVEAAWSALTGETSIGRYVAHFLLPTLLGNTAGGVALTALLNHAPIPKELHSSRAASRLGHAGFGYALDEMLAIEQINRMARPRRK